jgi:hypothetical protein
MFLLKYGAGGTFLAPMIKRATVDYAVGADWTPAAGDVKVIKDGGSPVNINTLPTAFVSGNGATWLWTLSVAESQAAAISIVIVDAATKTVEDNQLLFETFGHASAKYLPDWTADVAQTGDAYARLGAPVGVSVSADLLVLDNLVDDLESRLTAARAGYLDNLNVGGNVASSAEATSIQNNTRVVRVVPDVIERPDAGTVTYRIELLLYDDAGNMEAPDAAPTVALVNQAGTDRSSRLDSATMALVSAGRYRVIYTADVGDALEQLVWTFSVVEGGATRLYGNQSLIVDTTAVDFTAADRTKLEAVHSKLPSKSYLVGTGNSDGDVQLDEVTGTIPTASRSAIALAVWAETVRTLSSASDTTGVTTLLSRLSATLAAKLLAHSIGVLEVTVGSGSTTTQVKLATVEGAAPSSVNDFYNGAVLVITSGALAGQRTSITDYDGATTMATVVALTAAPAEAVTAVIV